MLLAVILALSLQDSDSDYDQNRQAFALASEASRELRFYHLRPFAGLTELPAFSREWAVNSFFAGRTTIRQGQTYWIIRRQTPDAVVWADSRTCPAAATAMTELQNVSPPRLNVPGVDEPETIRVTGDGVVITLWSQALSAQNYVERVEMTGNVTSEAGRWWFDGLDSLAGCWSSAEPEL